MYYQLYTLEVLINFFPNEKVQNLNIIWHYVMEKILLILVLGYTYLYIILFENTYICIKCQKIIACLKNKSSLELFGNVFLWLIIVLNEYLSLLIF